MPDDYRIQTIGEDGLREAIHEVSIESLELATNRLIEESGLLSESSQVHSCLISSLCSLFCKVYGPEMILVLLKEQINAMTKVKSDDISL